MKQSSMELHSPVAAKRMWNYLRAVFFMMRKGLMSKRKLVVSMHLMMKRSNKVVGRSVTNLLSHHHNHHPNNTFALHREYEFSCSNSPNPAFFHGSISKRRLAYFPCLGAVVEEPYSTPWRPAVALQRIEYSPSPGLSQELARGAQLTPARSPFSVRISDYSSEEEGEQGGNEEVDNEAEEFIRTFYEQLRTQNQIALLHYHEMECQEMLARGM